MVDPYAALDERTKAKIELDALPKDETHPFYGMTPQQAQRVYEEMLDAKGLEVLLTPEQRLLAEAYAQKVAAEAMQGEVAAEFQAQEQAILDSR